MAKTSKLIVTCKIDRIEDNPLGGANVFINCNIGMRKWVKELWVKYDRPISMEFFKKELAKTVMPSNEDDDLRFVKQEADKPFTIEVKK